MNLATKLVRNNALTTAELDGEVVMLSLETDRYYGLNTVASRIWELLEQPKTLAEVCDTLLSEFEVTRERCEGEVIAIAQKLLDEKLANLV